MESESSLRSIITHWLHAQGLSQRRAASRLRVPPVWLRRYLAGDIRSPRLATVKRLAVGLGIPEPVIRLARLQDEVADLARAIELTLEEVAGLPATAVHGDMARMVADAAAQVQALRESMAIDEQRFTTDTDEDEPLLARLTPRQKRALRELLEGGEE